MSERTFPPDGSPESTTFESGLETLESDAAFRGPVEGFDDHYCNDHFAQIYETDEERLTAAVPFVRHGLENDERVIYVVDEGNEPEVRSALRDAGLDVDAALDSGALSFHTVQDTYLRGGAFDPDGMIDFYADTVATATEEYEALRIVAETTWLQDDATTVEQFMEYESKVNELFADEDCFALCQYDRDGFSAEILENIVQTHPHLVYDGAVCHNVYYTPPAEFFSEDRSARRVDRMLGTLRERTAAENHLAQHERFLRDLYEITASRERSFQQKLRALFELGCEQFDLEFGFLNRVDPDDDRLEVEYASGDHDHYRPGLEFPLSETYCQAAVDIEAAANVSNPAEEGFDDRLVYEDFGVDGYLGTYVPVDGGTDRTLAFVPDGSLDEPFTEQEKAYLELMGQWVGYELNRRQREQFLRECYEITSDPALDFEAKLHRLLDLARERTGLEAAGLTHLPESDGKFLNEYAIGYGSDGDGVVDASDDVWTDPSEGCYCRQAISADEPVGMADVRGTDWEDDEIHRELGLSCYLGTNVTDGSRPYGTLWVGSTEPRDREFTDTERTFLELIGQWVSYELERREHNAAQEKLYDITSDPDLAFEEKLDALFDLGSEQFGLDIGGMVEVRPETDRLVVEHVSEEHGNFRPGLEPPMEGTYCGAAYGADEAVTITDPVAEGYADGYAYQELGFEAFLGTHIEVEGDHDRLFFFTTTEPRDREFSDAERTFVELLGQWVKNELERRQRERDLQERTDHLSALVETTPECIKTVAEDGTLLQMNPAGLEMVEADSSSDVVGECVYDLIAPEHRDRFSEFNERICSGERGTLEFDIVGLDGTRRHMESHAAPLERPDGTTAHVALTRDVTEQRERERELERIERQFEATFNNPSSFVGILDPDGTVRRINETALEFAGVDEPDVRGEKFWETPWFAHSEAVRERLRDGIERAADGEYVRTEVPHRSPDGDTVIMDAMLEPVYDDDEVVAVVPSGYDITERKEHAERLERKTDRLESFASMLAHELRNPVNIGQIYSQQLPAEADSEAAEYITEAFDRIEDMIDVMLVLTRGSEAVDEGTPVELAEITREAWSEVDAPEATLDLELRRTIRADETYVRHLFQNLLENAVEHGGADVTVTVGELDDGFYVADDGVGIAAEDRDAVFDEGYTTAADNGGTGLGLAFVEKLAEVYEWDLAVTESEAGGARFEFRDVT